MAVIACDEIWDGRQGTVNAEYQRTYTRVFRVRTNNALDGPATVRLYSGLPARYEFYSTASDIDVLALAREIDVQQDQNDPFFWTATVKYDTVFPELKHEGYASGGNSPDPSNSENQPDDPVSKPPTYSWGFNEVKVAIDKDRDDAPLVNSAGDRFDPPVEIEKPRLTLSVRKNVRNFSVSTALQYVGAINDDVFFGADPGKAKCKGIKASRSFENNRFFWEVDYEFEFDRDGWRLRILDQGYSGVSTTGAKILFKDQSNQPMSSPTLLDGAGHALADGGDPVFLDFDIYPELPFADLGLT